MYVCVCMVIILINPITLCKYSTSPQYCGSNYTTFFSHIITLNCFNSKVIRKYTMFIFTIVYTYILKTLVLINHCNVAWHGCHVHTPQAPKHKVWQNAQFIVPAPFSSKTSTTPITTFFFYCRSRTTLLTVFLFLCSSNSDRIL